MTGGLSTAGVALLYALLSLVMTWPLIGQLGAQIPAGAGGDVWVHEWTFWWIERAIALGQNPFYTELLFHPNGVALTTHNIAWFNIGLWYPLQAAFGNEIAYSLTYPLIFTLNGFALYLLALRCTGSRGAAFIGGLIYAFWPYLTSQSGHPNMLTVGWLPLALLYLMRTLDRGTRRDALLTALFIALQGIARWQLLIIGGMVLALYVLYRLGTDASVRTWRTMGHLVLIGVVALLLMAPLGGPVVASQITGEYGDEVFINDGEFGVDLLAWVVPNANLGLWRNWVEHLPERLQFRHDRVDFIGYTTLVLCIIGMVTRRRRAAFWLAAAVLLGVLALGTQLTVGHRTFPEIPMPYRWVDDLFFIRIVRRPHRFDAFLALPVAMMAAWGMMALGRVRALTGWRPLLTGVIAVLILAEGWVLPYRMTPVATPAWYAQLAQEPGDFAILGLPMSPRLADKFYMHYQITHGKPLVEGHVSRPTKDAFDFLESSEFLDHLAETNEMDPSLGDITRQLRVLAAANVRYLVLHKGLATDEQLADWRTWLAIAPWHEDADVIVYRTQPELGVEFGWAHELTDALGLLHVAVEPTALHQSEPLGIDALWAAAAELPTDRRACMTLRDGDGRPAQEACFDLGGAFPTSQWQPHEVVRDRYDFRVDPFLPPGAYTVDLTLTDPDGNAVAAPLALGALQVEPLPRTFDEPQPQQPFSVQLGEQVRLLGFDLEQSPELLRVTPYWQAQQRMPQSYKVFAHLVDAQTGEIVAQWDAMPRQWTYPTTWWEAGEVVADTIELSVTDAPAGTYQLLVGLYDEATSDRLPAVAAGERFPDDAIHLTTVQHEHD